MAEGSVRAEDMTGLPQSFWHQQLTPAQNTILYALLKHFNPNEPINAEGFKAGCTTDSARECAEAFAQVVLSNIIAPMSTCVVDELAEHRARAQDLDMPQARQKHIQDAIKALMDALYKNSEKQNATKISLKGKGALPFAPSAKILESRAATSNNEAYKDKNGNSPQNQLFLGTSYNEPYISNGTLYVQEQHGGSYSNATKGQHWRITPQCRSSDNAMVVSWEATLEGEAPSYCHVATVQCELTRSKQHGEPPQGVYQISNSITGREQSMCLDAVITFSGGARTKLRIFLAHAYAKKLSSAWKRLGEAPDTCDPEALTLLDTSISNEGYVKFTVLLSPFTDVAGVTHPRASTMMTTFKTVNDEIKAVKAAILGNFNVVACMRIVASEEVTQKPMQVLQLCIAGSAQATTYSLTVQEGSAFNTLDREAAQLHYIYAHMPLLPRDLQEVKSFLTLAYPGMELNHNATLKHWQQLMFTIPKPQPFCSLEQFGYQDATSVRLLPGETVNAASNGVWVMAADLSLKFDVLASRRLHYNDKNFKKAAEGGGNQLQLHEDTIPKFLVPGTSSGCVPLSYRYAIMLWLRWCFVPNAVAPCNEASFICTLLAIVVVQYMTEDMLARKFGDTVLCSIVIIHSAFPNVGKTMLQVLIRAFNGVRAVVSGKIVGEAAAIGKLLQTSRGLTLCCMEDVNFANNLTLLWEELIRRVGDGSQVHKCGPTGGKAGAQAPMTATSNQDPIDHCDVPAISRVYRVEFLEGAGDAKKHYPPAKLLETFAGMNLLTGDCMVLAKLVSSECVEAITETAQTAGELAQCGNNRVNKHYSIMCVTAANHMLLGTPSHAHFLHRHRVIVKQMLLNNLQKIWEFARYEENVATPQLTKFIECMIDFSTLYNPTAMLTSKLSEFCGQHVMRRVALVYGGRADWYAINVQTMIVYLKEKMAHKSIASLDVILEQAQKKVDQHIRVLAGSLDFVDPSFVIEGVNCVDKTPDASNSVQVSPVLCVHVARFHRRTQQFDDSMLDDPRSILGKELLQAFENTGSCIYAAARLHPLNAMRECHPGTSFIESCISGNNPVDPAFMPVLSRDAEADGVMTEPLTVDQVIHRAKTCDDLGVDEPWHVTNMAVLGEDARQDEGELSSATHHSPPRRTADVESQRARRPRVSTGNTPERNVAARAPSVDARNPNSPTVSMPLQMGFPCRGPPLNPTALDAFVQSDDEMMLGLLDDLEIDNIFAPSPPSSPPAPPTPRTPTPLNEDMGFASMDVENEPPNREPPRIVRRHPFSLPLSVIEVPHARHAATLVPGNVIEGEITEDTQQGVATTTDGRVIRSVQGLFSEAANPEAYHNAPRGHRVNAYTANIIEAAQKRISGSFAYSFHSLNNLLKAARVNFEQFAHEAVKLANSCADTGEHFALDDNSGVLLHTVSGDSAPHSQEMARDGPPRSCMGVATTVKGRPVHTTSALSELMVQDEMKTMRTEMDNAVFVQTALTLFEVAMGSTPPLWDQNIEHPTEEAANTLMRHLTLLPEDLSCRQKVKMWLLVFYMIEPTHMEPPPKFTAVINNVENHMVRTEYTYSGHVDRATLQPEVWETMWQQISRASYVLLYDENVRGLLKRHAALAYALRNALPWCSSSPPPSPPPSPTPPASETAAQAEEQPDRKDAHSREVRRVALHLKKTISDFKKLSYEQMAAQAKTILLHLSDCRRDTIFTVFLLKAMAQQFQNPVTYAEAYMHNEDGKKGHYALMHPCFFRPFPLEDMKNPTKRNKIIEDLIQETKKFGYVSGEMYDVTSLKYMPAAMLRLYRVFFQVKADSSVAFKFQIAPGVPNGPYRSRPDSGKWNDGRMALRLNMMSWAKFIDQMHSSYTIKAWTNRGFELHAGVRAQAVLATWRAANSLSTPLVPTGVERSALQSMTHSLISWAKTLYLMEEYKSQSNPAMGKLCAMTERQEALDSHVDTIRKLGLCTSTPADTVYGHPDFDTNPVVDIVHEGLHEYTSTLGYLCIATVDRAKLLVLINAQIVKQAVMDHKVREAKRQKVKTAAQALCNLGPPPPDPPPSPPDAPEPANHPFKVVYNDEGYVRPGRPPQCIYCKSEGELENALCKPCLDTYHGAVVPVVVAMETGKGPLRVPRKDMAGDF